MTEKKISELLSVCLLEDERKEKKNILNLPFIKKNKNHVVFWSAKPSGDYVKDCHKGRIYGAIALEYMVKADFKPLFTWCIMDMPKKNCSGIEVGFIEFFSDIAFHRLAAVS
jgi:hypothetical protein